VFLLSVGLRISEELYAKSVIAYVYIVKSTAVGEALRIFPAGLLMSGVEEPVAYTQKNFPKSLDTERISRYTPALELAVMIADSQLSASNHGKKL